MAQESDVANVAIKLLEKENLTLVSCKVLQSLWAGYGHICHVVAQSSTALDQKSLILKHIKPPITRSNGTLPNEGHIRKILSYQVEQHFYTHLAPQMPEGIAVASCLASASTGANNSATAMLLTDLRETHPAAGEKRAELSEKQTYAALEWLARFHGFWCTKAQEFDRTKLCEPPLEHFSKRKSAALTNEGVWLNGGYT
jgi:hypothetical protein